MFPVLEAAPSRPKDLKVTNSTDHGIVIDARDLVLLTQMLLFLLKIEVNVQSSLHSEDVRNKVTAEALATWRVALVYLNFSINEKRTIA